MVERDGLYDVSVHKMLSESELKPETVFECLLTIPGTSYAAREETMYFPGKGDTLFNDFYDTNFINDCYDIVNQRRHFTLLVNAHAGLLLFVTYCLQLLMIS